MKRQRRTRKDSEPLFNGQTVDDVMQGVVDLYCAQLAANNGQVDLVALQCSVARAVWRDAWSDDLLDQLPPRISHCLATVVSAALALHQLDQVFDDIESRARR